VRVLTAGLVVMLGCGCAAQKTYEPISAPLQLPTKAAMAQVAQRPVPPVSPRKQVDVDRWSFEGQWMESEASTPAPNLRDSIARSAGVQVGDPHLDCLAEQSARFYLEHEVTPGPRLAAYMSVRCGGLAYPGAVSLGAVGIAGGPPDATDEEVLAKLLPRAQEQVARVLGDKSEQTIVGAWLQRQRGKAAIGLVLMPRARRMQIRSLGDGRVTISGAIADAEAVAVVGLINRGPHGWAECQVEGTPRQFRMTCALAPEDQGAWIDVAVQRRGHLIARTVARAFAHREGPTGITYPEAKPAAPVADAASFRQALLTRLNEVRRSAKLAPLTLAQNQSASLDGVAPHYFAALEIGDETTLDLITLGTLAGWDVVGGLIRDAHVLGIYLPVRRDAQAWLDETLERPIGRRTLLGPWARQLALGATFDRPTPGIGALIATYAFMEEQAVAEEARRLVARLNDERTARGHRPVHHVEDMPELDEAAVRVAAGVHPGRALDDAVARAAERRRTTMAGSWTVAAKVDDIPFADELLYAEAIEVAVRVAHVSIQGSNWGFTVALLTTARGPDRRPVASRASPPSTF